MPFDPATEQLASRIADHVAAILRSRPLDFRLPSPWLSTEESAQYLKLSVKTLQTFRLQGTGPPWVARGKRVRRYHIDALNAWLASGAGE